MKWIKASERLPEVGESVLVRTEYESTASGKKEICNDFFIGYSDEFGDLITKPEEDSYGWNFKECVTHWMPLPKPPQYTEGEDAPSEQDELWDDIRDMIDDLLMFDDCSTDDFIKNLKERFTITRKP